MRVGNSNINIITPEEGLKNGINKIEDVSKMIVNKAIKNQDPIESLVNLKEYENLSKANAKALQTQNSVIGSIIDIKV